MSVSRTSGAKLPAVDREDLAMLRDIGAASRRHPAEEAAPRYRHALRVAALLGDFDPTVLLPKVSERELNRLLTDCTVSACAGQARWRLSMDARRRVLREHGSGPALRTSIAQARAYLAGGGDEDPLTRALLQIAGGEAPGPEAIAEAGPAGWAAYRSALSAVHGTPLGQNAAAAALAVQVPLAELLAPFRFLTGWNPQAQTDLFVGRDEELSRLRAFVDVLDAPTIGERVSRGVGRLLGAPMPMLVLSGIGGSGKSTLVAKFVLDHMTRPGRSAPLCFAYLDFDRTTLSPLQPGALLREIARQIGWQLPAAGARLGELAEQLEQDIAASVRHAAAQRRDDALPPDALGPAVLHRYARLICSAVRKAVPKARVLVVLDTFEEAQALGNEAVARIEALTAPLLEDPHWRILVAGRDEVEGAFPTAARLELDELDAPSRREFLHRRGVPAGWSARIAKDVGGRPLALLLAAKLVSEGHHASLQLSLGKRAMGLFRPQLTEGILYQRIIEHIRDPDVRRIAHPGLVLRRLDVDVLLEVVAPVLDLRWLDRARADKVLAALRLQKDLVRTLEDGSVAHRADVRRQMLRLMAEDEPERTAALHQRAVEYYARRSESDAQHRVRYRTEEIYHRLCLAHQPGRDLDEVSRRWLPGCRIGLANAVDDMFSARGRAALQLKLGQLPALADAEQLPAWLASEYAQRALANAVSYDDPMSGIEALGRVGWALDVKTVYRDFCLLHDRAGDWGAAATAYHGWLSESRWSEESVLAAADFHERSYGEGTDFEQLRAILHALAGLRGLAPQLALARLRLRHGEQSQLSLPDPRPRSAASREELWIYALGLEPAFEGRDLLFRLSRTPRGRLQLEFMSAQLRLLEHRLPPWDEAIDLCHILLTDEKLNERTCMRLLAVHAYEAVELLLLHLVRPATPQWYVPIAQALLHQLGTVETSAVFDHPALQEGLLPGRVGGTRSLADVLSHLDSFGLLEFMLQRLASERRLRPTDQLNRMLVDYERWRYDVLGYLDRQLAPLAPASTAPRR